MLASIVVTDAVNYHHQDIDSIMDTVCKVIRNSLRGTDSVFRYGANNLYILLPFTGKEGVNAVDEKIHQIYDSHSVINKKKGGCILVTASVSYPDDGKIGEKLLSILENNFDDVLKAISPKN
jgi:diguanylate cyclase (GGDEF)-like protein